MRRLQVFLTLTLVCMFGALILWVLTAKTRDAKLCGVLYSLVARSGATVGKPHTPGYAYYHAHPQELKLARRQNEEFLSELPCKER